jgi:hypothetical protein
MLIFLVENSIFIVRIIFEEGLFSAGEIKLFGADKNRLGILLCGK